ncbi:MAG: nucleotide sugar dehydrogenase [Gaiellaceae bacterium]
MSRITVTGIWHQGAVLSACLADLGHQVVGVCADEPEAQRLQQGDAPVPEPELRETILRNVAAGRLEYTTDLPRALAGCELVFISTDTPVRDDDSPDTAPLYELAGRIRDAGSGAVTLCVSAQVPVGTTEELAALVRSGGSLRLEGYAYVPEFLQLGTAVESFRAADRIVVGADDPATAERVAALYRPLERPVVLTTVRTAELAKHAANAFLATSISFVNEIADIAGAVDADPFAVADILRLDRRIGPHAYLSPGLGFAGGTLGREVRTLQQLGDRHDLDLRLAAAVLGVNDARSARLLERIRAGLDGLGGRRVALHGLTYKPGTPTLRRAASLELAAALTDGGASVRAFDPLATGAGADLGPITLGADIYDAAREADAVVLLAPTDDTVDLARLRREMRGDLLVDVSGRIGAGAAAAAGFRYTTLWSEAA